NRMSGSLIWEGASRPDMRYMRLTKGFSIVVTTLQELNARPTGKTPTNMIVTAAKNPTLSCEDAMMQSPFPIS
ncbi:hypothetical protein, partial [Castellaniella sp.]|uniref:hypothetical protein n=1 Tax=Castellaniella sp. TaxID=1955812 RepID=UPI003C791EA0